MEIREYPEESDGIIREADSVRSRVLNHTGNENIDELCGEPMRDFFSRGELGQWERVFSFEVTQGKDPEDGVFSDDATSEVAGNVL